MLHVLSALPLRAAAALERNLVQGYYEEEAQAVFTPVRSFLDELGIAATYLTEVGHAPT